MQSRCGDSVVAAAWYAQKGLFGLRHPGASDTLAHGLITIFVAAVASDARVIPPRAHWRHLASPGVTWRRRGIRAVL